MTLSGSEFEGEAIDMDSVAFAGKYFELFRLKYCLWHYNSISSNILNDVLYDILNFFLSINFFCLLILNLAFIRL